MAENGKSITLEFRELFDELGAPDGTVKLRQVTPPADAYTDPGTSTPDPADDVSLYKVIIDDPLDRRSLNVQGVDTKVFRVWGGALDPVLCRRAVHEAAFRLAMNDGGGIVYDGRLYKLLDFQRGFAVGDYVTNWYLVATTTTPLVR